MTIKRWTMVAAVLMLLAIGLAVAAVAVGTPEIFAALLTAALVIGLLAVASSVASLVVALRQRARSRAAASSL